ncbi:hypothetical protein ACFZDM_33440 [Streptomyces californicus]|uniref:hypothetical protein n=1 Tax=Streptomyces californicus TaxID=67351 RepID=UPI0036F0D32F
MSNENHVTDSTAETVVQAESTGPINTGPGDQHSVTFTGTTTGVTVIHGDQTGQITQTFTSKKG